LIHRGWPQWKLLKSPSNFRGWKAWLDDDDDDDDGGRISLQKQSQANA